MNPPQRHGRILARGVIVSLALALGSSRSLAQTDDPSDATRLTITTNVVTFAPPTVDDYASGFVTGATGITFTVGVASAGGRVRTGTVSIRATAATVGGGKPVSDVQWRRSDQANWNSLTLTNAAVEGHSMSNNVNNPWSNAIVFRILVNWRTDPPATYTADIEITLTQVFTL
jgi:hypothetical protein